MMIIEQMDIAVPHTEMKRIAGALEYLTDPTRLLIGCLSCRLFLGLPEEDMLRVEAHWASMDDLMRYLQSDTYKKFLLLMELGATAPVLKFFTVLEIQGFDLVREARNPSDQLKCL
ncbi:MAG TPA: antibiotic biosynthesis monooxygenase [Candidatus Acidoferrum sp.]|jgi:quinol monooxygenase YgiN